jgi:uncharacterized OsmC-like protein
MTPFPHVYETRVEGGPTGHSRLSAPGLPTIEFDSPPDFDGPGDAWSPEHLFVAAVQTCLLLTLRGVAKASKIEVLGIEVGGTGKVDRIDGVTRFTEIVLRPRVLVAAGTDRDRVLRVIEKSEKTCLVASSLSTRVRVEAEIREREHAGALIGR